MNEPGTHEDLQQTAEVIRADFRQELRRFEEQIANAIIALNERMDRRFDAMDKRLAAMDRRIESMENDLGRLEDNVGRLAHQFSGFADRAEQSDRSARILAIQAVQQRYAAKFLGHRPPVQ
jgi:archaellum component FlaC